MNALLIWIAGIMAFATVVYVVFGMRLIYHEMKPRARVRASSEPNATRLPPMISQSNLPEVREIQQKQEAVISVSVAISGAFGGALWGGDAHVVAEMEAVAWGTDTVVTDGQPVHPTSSLQSKFALSGVAVQRAA